jgi:hypothetical protein
LASLRRSSAPSRFGVGFGFFSMFYFKPARPSRNFPKRN